MVHYKPILRKHGDGYCEKKKTPWVVKRKKCCITMEPRWTWSILFHKANPKYYVYFCYFWSSYVMHCDSSLWFGASRFCLMCSWWWPDLIKRMSSSSRLLISQRQIGKIDIMLQRLKRQCSGEVGRLATRVFLSDWWVPLHVITVTS